MKLLEIQADQQAFLDLIDEAGGEITPENEVAINAMIEEIKANVAEKADSLCNFLAHLDAREAMYKERKEIFAKSEQTAKNTSKRVRDRFKEVGIANGWLSCSEPIPGQKKKKPGAKIETTSGWVVSVQNSGGVRALTIDESYKDIPEEYLIWEEPKIDKAKVRAALEAGQELPFAKLEPQGVTLIIK